MNHDTRKAGILLHLSSLPSPYGIGTMGAAAYSFVDFLAAAGQSVWQILPVCPTSFGDSPYQSFSTFAGNPYFIDLEQLVADGLLKKEDFDGLDFGTDPTCVDYGKLYTTRYPVLRKAAKAFLKNPPPEYKMFVRKNRDWLPDYALFMALKDAHGGAAWTTWEMPLRRREKEALAAAREQYAADISFWQTLQYLFYKQWNALKAYANSHGIEIVGDLPIYVAADSVDVWSNPGQFQLDKDLNPIEVAGCPPDGFSAGGQLWGNPLFDWDAMRKDKYSWWVRRIQAACSTYDVLRIDHFRGFAGYYAIPFGRPDAVIGRWRKGPGIRLFREVEKQIGPQRIIAEDLGFLTDEVRSMLKKTGFPGMKILEFAFDTRDDSDYLPHSYTRHCVVYIGTHDNEPVMSWFELAPKADVAHAIDYLKLSKEEGYHWGMMRGAWASVADLAVMQMQDVLGLGHETRMNTPNTLGGNWCWRVTADVFTPELAERLHHQMALFGRLPADKSEVTEKTDNDAKTAKQEKSAKKSANQTKK